MAPNAFWRFCNQQSSAPSDIYMNAIQANKILNVIPSVMG